jgi:hypothetical protein
MAREAKVDLLRDRSMDACDIRIVHGPATPVLQRAQKAEVVSADVCLTLPLLDTKLRGVSDHEPEWLALIPSR